MFVCNTEDIFYLTVQRLLQMVHLCFSLFGFAKAFPFVFTRLVRWLLLLNGNLFNISHEQSSGRKKIIISHNSPFVFNDGVLLANPLTETDKF